jgi:hypothetical protein
MLVMSELPYGPTEPLLDIDALYMVVFVMLTYETGRRGKDILLVSVEIGRAHV